LRRRALPSEERERKGSDGDDPEPLHRRRVARPAAGFTKVLRFEQAVVDVKTA
jgi:hypothetical protein